LKQPAPVVTKFGEDGLEDLRVAVAALMTAADTDSPVTRVGIVLVWHGRQGTTFTKAWASAMRSLPRDDDASEWRAIFKSQRDQWRTSYELRFGVTAAA
jgi:hypothetical protein